MSQNKIFNELTTSEYKKLKKEVLKGYKDSIKAWDTQYLARVPHKFLFQDFEFVIELCDEAATIIPFVTYADSNLQNDKYAWLKFIDKVYFNGTSDFLKIPELLRNDLEIVKRCIERFKNEDFLQHTTDTIRNNVDLHSVMLKQNQSPLRYSSTSNRDNEGFVNQCLHCGRTDDFFFISERLQKNEEIILRAMSYSSEPYKIYSNIASEIKSDKAFIKKALWYINERDIEPESELISKLLDDEGFLKDCIYCFGRLIKILPERYRMDYQYVKLAIQRNGENLQFAHHIIQGNKELVELACLTYPSILNSLNPRPEILFIGDLIKKKLVPWRILKDEIKREICQSKELLIELFQEGCAIYLDEIIRMKFISDALLNDIDLMVAAIKGFDANIEFVPEKMKENSRIINLLKVVDDLSQIYRYFPESLKNDSEVSTKAIQCNSFNIYYAGYNIRNDVNVLMYGLDRYQYYSQEIRSSLSIAIKAVEYDYKNFQYVCDELKSDIELIKLLVSINPGSFCWVSESCKNNIRLIEEILEQVIHPKIGNIASGCPDSLVCERDFMIKLLNLGCDIQSLPSMYNEDFIFLEHAIANSTGEQCSTYFSKASKKVKCSKELIFKMLQRPFSNQNSLKEKEKRLYNIYFGYESIDSNLLKDKEFVMQLLDIDVSFYGKLSMDLHRDQIIAEKSANILISIEFIQHCPAYLFDDFDFMHKVLVSQPDAFKNASYRLRGDSELWQLFIENVEDDKCNLEYATYEAIKNWSISIPCIKKNTSNLRHSDYDLKNYSDLLLIIASINPVNLCYAGHRVLEILMHDDFSHVPIPIYRRV